MSYSLHREAAQDLLEAARFYSPEGGAKLADHFLAEFERVARLLEAFPGVGTPEDELRQAHPLPELSVFDHLPRGRPPRSDPGGSQPPP